MKLDQKCLGSLPQKALALKLDVRVRNLHMPCPTNHLNCRSGLEGLFRARLKADLLLASSDQAKTDLGF